MAKLGCSLGMFGLVISAMASCSSVDTGPAVADVSSFHYVELGRFNLEGKISESREEGFYRAPDSAHTIGDSESSALGLENIVIGARVWIRDESGWREDASCYTAIDKMRFLLSIAKARSGFTDDGAGPTFAGEVTRRYRYVNEDAGKHMIDATARSFGTSAQNASVLESVRDTFSEVVGTTEILVGKQTERIYEYSHSLVGPKLEFQSEMTIDQYDELVEIQPPPNVPAEGEQRTSADCPDFDKDFPWIPAAVAAVLGPLAFLLASSFVWRRL